MNTTSQGIKCGKCSTFGHNVYHGSIAEIKACSTGTPSKPSPAPAAPKVRNAVQPMRFDRATPGQITYLTDLIGKVPADMLNGIDQAHRLTAQRVIEDQTVTFTAASGAIDAYKKMVDAAKATEQNSGGSELAELLKQVPNGGYCVKDATTGKNHFYVVKVVYKESGRRGVRERASDGLYRMYRNQQVAALKAILAAGKAESALMYATELDRCWNCHRSLTDNTGNPYKPYGLGPDCGPEKMGALS